MVERSAQQKDGGSTPTSSLHFSRTTLKEVKDFVKKYHYSHTYPGGIDFSFKAELNGELVGACLFGYMAGNPHAKIPVNGYFPPANKRRELMRLVLLDEMPKNSETKFVGWCLRYIRKYTDIVVIVSFADPVYGHTGVIYKAGNWTYLGLNDGGHDRKIIVDGKEVHPRMCVDIYGSSQPDKIRALGHNVEVFKRVAKHKYIYIYFGQIMPGKKNDYR